MGAPLTHERPDGTGPNQYLVRIWRWVPWWPTHPMKRMLRPAWTLAPLGAVLALSIGAVPVGAAEAPAAPEPWDPTPWVALGSGLVIATLVAADAKADRRGA